MKYLSLIFNITLVHLKFERPHRKIRHFLPNQTIGLYPSMSVYSSSVTVLPSFFFRAIEHCADVDCIFDKNESINPVNVIQHCEHETFKLVRGAF